VLRRDGISAPPLEVVITDVQPGIFTVGQNGVGQAAALLSGTAKLAAPGTPASRGGYVELYATGLGPVDNAPGDGEPASLAATSPVHIPVSVTLGGKPAQVVFAGLAPGTVGLYQVNIKVPDDAPTGDAVAVVIQQRNAVSNTATIAVR